MMNMRSTSNQTKRGDTGNGLAFYITLACKSDILNPQNLPNRIISESSTVFQQKAFGKNVYHTGETVLNNNDKTETTQTIVTKKTHQSTLFNKSAFKPSGRFHNAIDRPLCFYSSIGC